MDLRNLGLLNFGGRIIGLLILSLVWTFAQAQERTVILRDTLPAAVKTDIRQGEEHLPGVYRTDMASLRGKVLSPVGENDPIKFAMTRPGVASGAEGFSAIFVRGGNLGNNLMTLDGVRIYGISHLLGLTTALPDEAVSSVDFCLGGFGGEQGGVTASHLKLHSPELDGSKAKGTVGLSNTFLSASGQVPLLGKRASVFAAGRWSPFGLEYGLLRKGFDRSGKMPSMQLGVYDLYSKASLQIARAHRVDLSVLGTRDRYDLGFPGTDYLLGWENAIAHLAYRWEAGSRTTVRADVSYNHFRNNMEQEAVVLGDRSHLQLQTKLEEQSYGLLADHSFFDGELRLSEGVQHRRTVLSPAAMKSSESAISVIDDAPYMESVSRPVLTSGFLEVNGRLGPVEMMATVRGNYYKNRAERAAEAYSGFAAEISGRIKWQILSQLRLELTYDDRTQFDHTLEGTPLGWSLDLLVPSTSLLPPERSRQYYGGLFSAFAGQRVSVGGYYKTMDNLVYYTDAKALFTSAAQGWNDHAKVGGGTSYGAEFLYEGSFLGVETSVAYTWSKTDRRFPDINLGVPFPARYDRRHILNASVRWKGLSGALTLQSGHWETVPAGHYVGQLPLEEVSLNYFDHPNNYQMPFYIRVDLGYQFVFKSRPSTSRPLDQSLTVGVYNLLNRHNPSMLTYDTEAKNWNYVSLFPIMPSLKWQLRF